jgi:hypothetical protein
VSYFLVKFDGRNADENSVSLADEYAPAGSLISYRVRPLRLDILGIK